jgi:hypothetical protein
MQHTFEEAAKILILKVKQTLLNNSYQDGKSLATLIVNEILEYHDSLFDKGLKNVHQTFTTPVNMYKDVMNPQKKRLLEIKAEIEKLCTS